MEEIPTMFPPSRFAAKTLETFVRLTGALKESATPAMLTMLGETADGLQKDILSVSKTDTTEKSMMVAGKELFDIEMGVRQLLKCVQKFKKGKPGSPEFETYARANRAYKSWLTAVATLEAAVQRESITEARGKVLERNVLAPLKLMREQLKIPGGITASGEPEGK